MSKEKCKGALKIKLKIKIAILFLLLSAALYSGAQAIGSVEKNRQCSLPEKIYGEFEEKAADAQFYVKNSGGYVTVFEDRHYRNPLRVTEIETDCLRKADIAMLEKGIPVTDRTELLRLLEDLGS